MGWPPSPLSSRWSGGSGEAGEENHVRRWGRAGIVLSIVGAAIQVMFIISRFLIGGRSIAASMFEFTAFLAFALVLAFILIYYLYRTPALGAFVLPLAVVLLAYASVFPKEVRPLIPALQSYWLHIHVTLAALGEGAFAVGFIAGLIYLIRVVGTRRQFGPCPLFGADAGFGGDVCRLYSRELPLCRLRL